MFCYDIKLKKLVKYGFTEGLPNEVIYGILEDDNDCLWISTNQGLSQFNIGTKTFKNFTQSDGLQSNEFNYMSYTKTSTNELVFGGALMA
ncbi:two-component system sensor histidine kinase/response [Algibacter lectus]|uniref:Two-component system sensor histidine kinase/response n=1 Tax=Algibacter lectus TaxID=221126 RepID=A0A090WYP5_9FLAO|nr:two-component regulator propeller domain-containing protein [Algibacter lectus]GAL82091.1 two-component system sensor histidine kinase/response [Algibacter lectus]